MEEIFEICDRITVLRDGEYIGVKDIPKTSFQEIVRRMVGRELGERFRLKDNEIGQTIFEVTNLERMGHFKNINFDVKQGEILGVAGLMGAGRTEIMEAIFGFKKKDNGSVYLNGKELKINRSEEHTSELQSRGHLV